MRIEVEANDFLEFVSKSEVVGDLERAHSMRLKSPCPFHTGGTQDGLSSTALALAGAVQWVASCGGAWLVSAMTRSTVSAGNGGDA